MADGENTMSLIIGEEEYQLNQRRIEEARRYVDNWDAMNEQAKKEYDRMQEDLQKKIQEGEDARRMLRAMQEQQANRKHQLAIAGPSGHNVPQATNHLRNNLPVVAGAPATTSRIEEVPATNYVPYQPHGTMPPYNTSSSNHAPTSAQVRQYPPNANQQAHINVPSSGDHPNWAQYIPTASNRLPTQPGPTVLAGVPYGVLQPVPQQRYGSSIPTQAQQQQQQTRVPQGQPLQARPTQGSSTGIKQGSYPTTQATSANLPLNHQQGTTFTTVQQQGNTYLTHHQLDVQYPGSQSATKLKPHSHSPVVTMTAPMQMQQSIPRRPQSLNSQIRVSLANTVPATHLGQASSSLAGALGGTAKVPTTPSTDISRSQPVLSGTMSNAPKQQRGTGSTSQTPSATGAIYQPSPFTAPVAPQIPPQASPSNTSSMDRLKVLLSNWERDAPPQSYFELPGARVKIYKDQQSKVYLVTPDNKGSFVYIGASSFGERFSTITQGKAIVPPNITGHTQASKDSSTTIRQTVFRFREELPGQPSMPGANFSGRAQTVDLSNSSISQNTTKPQTTVPLNATGHSQVSQGPPTVAQPAVSLPNGEQTGRPWMPSVITLDEGPAPLSRTPKDADKAHLARDILRALTKKRPRPESVSIPSQEPSAKRHAPDIGDREILGGVIPNTVVNSSVSNAPLHAIPETLTTTQTQPPVLGPPPLQSVFRIQMQAPAVMPSSVVAPQPMIPPNMVYPLPPRVVLDEPVSAPHITTVSPASPITQPPPEKTPLVVTNGVSSSSRSLTSQVEPVVNKLLPSVADPPDNDREKTPLFLPSPSSSPLLQGSRGVSIKPDADLTVGTKEEMTTPSESLDSRGKGKRKGPSCYVLVPPLPKYVKRFKAKQRATMKEDTVWHSSVPASDGFVTDDVQGEAVQQSCTRLSKRPCRLGGCDAILNSTQALLDHISQEHRPKRARCQWPQCGRQYKESKAMFYHIRSHALIPLECAYEDCRESFRTPQQLVRHHEAVHRNSSLKPSAALFTPQLSPLPVAPESLPAYMVEARQVQPPSISKDRHSMLGPWVLRNISGPVNLKTKRYNAAQPLRSQVERPGNQPYDFMTYSSTNFSTTSSQPAKVAKLDDLPSVVVSEMTYDGMVLWQAPEVKVEKPTVEISLIESRATTDELTLSNQMPGTRSPLSRGDNHSDEEAVENMLTG